MENVHNGNIEIISFVGKLRSKPALTVVATRENIVSSKKLCEAHIKIFECLIDNVFVMLDERVLQ
jgi:hypothetical protein